MFLNWKKNRLHAGKFLVLEELSRVDSSVSDQWLIRHCSHARTHVRACSQHQRCQNWVPGFVSCFFPSRLPKPNEYHLKSLIVLWIVTRQVGKTKVLTILVVLRQTSNRSLHVRPCFIMSTMKATFAETWFYDEQLKMLAFFVAVSAFAICIKPTRRSAFSHFLRDF